MVTNFERAARRMRRMHDDNPRQALGLRSGNLMVVLYEAWNDQAGRLRVVRICGYPDWATPLHELRGVAALLHAAEDWRAGEQWFVSEATERRSAGGAGRSGRFALARSGWSGGPAYWSVVARDRPGRVSIRRLSWPEPQWVRWLDEKVLGAGIGPSACSGVTGPGVRMIGCAE